jgi:tetratricopeptide (TPR) repeat protein
MVEARLNLATILFKKGNRGEAINAWRWALEQKLDAMPGAQVNLSLGRALAGGREWREAAACYARALQLAPTDDGHL